MFFFSTYVKEIKIAIRMSHLRHTKVDDAEFLVMTSFSQKFCCLQVIQSSASSTILWHQYDIRIWDDILLIQFCVVNLHLGKFGSRPGGG